jgi:hypothetical protein
MNNIFFDSELSDRKRLELLYVGDLFVFSPMPATIALRDHARSIILEVCGGIDPLRLQEETDTPTFEAVVATITRAFTRNPRSRELIRKLLAEARCDPERTYLNVPRLHVAREQHPHRDTWHAAPPSQINWRTAIYDFVGDNGIAFHANYWMQAVANDSERFDYYDRRVLLKPRAQEALKLNPHVRLLPETAELILSSGAHLTSMTPNSSGQTRWSVDFSTVNIDDVVAHRGARNTDARPTGTSLREFAQTHDGRRLPEELVREYDDGPFNGRLVFTPAVMPAPN